LIALATSINVADCNANNFGIHFSGDGAIWGGWGPYYLNQVGAHGAGPYASAFGVAAADWYEPGPISQTSQLPGSPTSVNFQPASMGSGSVNFAWSSAHPDTGPQNGYTFIPYGFSNANRFVMQLDQFGDPILDQDGHYVPVDPVMFAPDNGVPPSGEHAVFAGALFATDGIEYAPTWSAQRDIVVTITGLSSIASGYTVKLLAAVQNGNVVEAFTPATITDNASNTDMVDFVLLPDKPSYWSPFDPDPMNPYVSVAGEAESTTMFTGDSLEIRLSGANEYTNVNTFEFSRTILSGVIIDYVPIEQPDTPGDYNGDNKVDASDYVLWRKDPNAHGGDPAGYNTWRANFGTGTGSGSGLAGNGGVPEPGSCISAVILAVVLVARRGRLKKG
jgi:hypothetical protein